MKTTARSILSAATALGLASFTTLSFAVLGAAAPATVLSFSLLAVYGVAEIAILAYSPRPYPRAARTPLPAVADFDVVEFPTNSNTRRAA